MWVLRVVSWGSNDFSVTKGVSYRPKGVSLAGNFNCWDVNETQMKKDEKGNWKVTVDLPPGRHEYRFWVDGVWQDDPNAQEMLGNSYGCHNCVRVVG